MLTKGGAAIDRIIKDVQRSIVFLHEVRKNLGLHVFWTRIHLHVHEVMGSGHASLALKSGHHASNGSNVLCCIWDVIRR